MKRNIEHISKKVQMRDMVKINLENSSYVGYVWPTGNSKSIALCGLDPHGNTKSLGKSAQPIILDIEKATLGDEKVKSYEIIKKYKT